MGDVAAKTGYWSVKSCDATKITLHAFAADVAAGMPGVPTAEEITTSLGAATGAVTLTYD